MRKVALFVGGLVLSALACAPAMAEVVRVKVMARVSHVNDYYGSLNGKIIAGTRMSGTYVYNTNTPNQSQDPQFTGEYHPYANEARVRFAAGGFVFESNQPTQGITIQIQPENSSLGQFFYVSDDNKPISNDNGVMQIIMRLMGSGPVTQSSALPAVAPDLTGYHSKDVLIFGTNFDLRAEIESAELIVADAIEVSPASGSFVHGQQFDAALLLPRNSNVVSAQASANGNTLPLNYPGNCYVPPPNSTGRVAIVCPDAHQSLWYTSGAPIEWTVVLSNGTTLTQTVNWTLIQ
ncbi:hypothetical protein [Steroidobacter cummioxidans]|uniref:hypothetical protein n=1 Tax=Steroidobacter cummioxidans TaxID=1803913 RepID=UPI000E311541|nr:hypothetical protein [Steroidobacter cummioxidans]